MRDTLCFTGKVPFWRLSDLFLEDRHSRVYLFLLEKNTYVLYLCKHKWIILISTFFISSYLRVFALHSPFVHSSHNLANVNATLWLKITFQRCISSNLFLDMLMGCWLSVDLFDSHLLMIVLYKYTLRNTVK